MALNQQQKGKSGSPGGAGAPPDIQRAPRIWQEVLLELRKTTWPTKEEATRLTLVVLAVITAAGIYMGILDAVLSFIVNRFSLIK
ncbi:MAG: preprotein translocase subunit SecE [Chloroherpetonaceae bacterium]|nr:preprotein translocase subunit SecE [Chthonomonadaceae bacterium]MDW8207066.1 preprotein translocase subunit SecE [Chloroherpetonaceae bacterium]